MRQTVIQVTPLCLVWDDTCGHLARCVPARQQQLCCCFTALAHPGRLCANAPVSASGKALEHSPAAGRESGSAVTHVPHSPSGIASGSPSASTPPSSLQKTRRVGEAGGPRGLPTPPLRQRGGLGNPPGADPSPHPRSKGKSSFTRLKRRALRGEPRLNASLHGRGGTGRISALRQCGGCGEAEEPGPTPGSTPPLPLSSSRVPGLYRAPPAMAAELPPGPAAAGADASIATGGAAGGNGGAGGGGE